MKKHRKIFCLALFCILTTFGFSQAKGVQFEHGLSWQKILAKAKKENKYIFLDCFATWCEPCKMMDKNVYPNDSVGNYINGNFIPVRIQMDTSKTDDPQIKSGYTDAHAIQTKYHVDAFPTFLFISPQGRIVHEAVGYIDIQDFISVAKDALNPQRQYFTLLENFERGRRDFSTMAYLAQTAIGLNDKKQAFRIANDYINQYLIHLKDELLYTKENIGLIVNFIRSSKDKGFRIIYLNADKVNKVMEDSIYAQTFVEYTISKEEVYPVVLTAAKDSLESPDWEKIRSSISNKYSQNYADRTIADAIVNWYGFKKNWPLFTKYSAARLEKYGSTMSHDDLNANSWSIFLFSFNKAEINTAIFWMRDVVKTETDSVNTLPACLDTYANLIYKSGGRKEEAIEIEQKALDLIVKFGNPIPLKQFQNTIDKMLRGEPTW